MIKKGRTPKGGKVHGTLLWFKTPEREKDFLLFLRNSKKPQTIKNILESVWGYSEKMETHTIETHVHRLRKKFLDSFNDKNFIKNNKEGYYI